MNKIKANTMRINLSNLYDSRLILEHVLKNAHNKPTMMQNAIKLWVMAKKNKS